MEPSSTSSRRRSEDLVPWSDEYSVGVRIIDTDHKNLFEIINTLHAGIRRGLGGRELDIAMAGLTRYVDEHFEREENLMKEYHYPGLANHREVHQNLIRTVYAMRKVQTSQPAAIDLKKLMKFLGDWLVNHVVKTDVKYVPYLRGEVPQSGGPDDGAPGEDAAGVGDETAGALTSVTVQVPAGRAEVLKRCALLLRRGGDEAQAISDVTDPISSMTLDEAKQICSSVLK